MLVNFRLNFALIQEKIVIVNPYIKTLVVSRSFCCFDCNASEGFFPVEHILSMLSATGLDCPLEEYFERYILSSHGFLLQACELVYYF